MIRLVVSALVLNFSVLGYAQAGGGHTAVITRLKGSASIFSNDQSKKPSNANLITFEGENYFEMPAKSGAKLGKGDVILTNDDAQVRLIFKNGDSLSVGPSTSYKISWNKDDSAPLINVFYGKVRGIFKKDGPRTGTAVHTKSSVMGVRGTDFYVAAGAATAISVLRGEVALKSKKPGAKEVSLQTGFTAKIDDPSTKKAAPSTSSSKTSAPTTPSSEPDAEEDAVTINQTTRGELVDIQTKSTIKQIASPTQPTEAAAEPEQVAELAELEKQAVETVMADIKVTDPILFAKISDDKTTGTDMDRINTVSVGEMFKKAPISNANTKPTDEELKGLGEDAYDKYFKID